MKILPTTALEDYKGGDKLIGIYNHPLEDHYYVLFDLAGETHSGPIFKRMSSGRIQEDSLLCHRACLLEYHPLRSGLP